MNSTCISSAMDAAQIEAQVLDMSERDSLAKSLLENLFVDVASRAPWDSRKAPEGIFCVDGWQLIPGYVGDRSCCMFQSEARVVWKLKNGSELFRVLKECPLIEFYVCDIEASYLLCSNDHDLLIGWGVAEQWVKNLGAAE
jgi:hypothetical protein